jgi:hypothetical protein
VGHLLQEVCILERGEDSVGAWRIEIPHALRLPLRQMQPWHLGELRLNQSNPITKVLEDRLLHGTSLARIKGKHRTTHECVNREQIASGVRHAQLRTAKNFMTVGTNTAPRFQPPVIRGTTTP